MDVENLTAKCNPDFGKKVVGKKEKSLKVKPLAEEIAHQIVSENHEDERLNWQQDGRVSIKIAKVIPKTNQQTTANRRKNFIEAVEPILKDAGWISVKATAHHTFEKDSQLSSLK